MVFDQKRIKRPIHSYIHTIQYITLHTYMINGEDCSIEQSKEREAGANTRPSPNLYIITTIITTIITIMSNAVTAVVFRYRLWSKILSS